MSVKVMGIFDPGPIVYFLLFKGCYYKCKQVVFHTSAIYIVGMFEHKPYDWE